MTETCQRCGMRKATAAEREGRVASIVHMTCFGADDCATRLAKRVKKLEAERSALLEQLTLLNDDVGLETERRWQNVVAMVRKDEQAKAETSLVEASQWRSRAEKAEGILATIDAVHVGNKPSIIEMAHAIRDAEARAKKLEQYLRDCSLAVSVEYDAPHLVPGDVINRIERDSESIDKAEARVRELLDAHAKLLDRLETAKARVRELEAERDRLARQNHELVGFGYGDDAYIIGLEKRIKLADAIVANNATTAELLTRGDKAEATLAETRAQLARLREAAEVFLAWGHRVDLDGANFHGAAMEAALSTPSHTLAEREWHRFLRLLSEAGLTVPGKVGASGPRFESGAQEAEDQSSAWAALAVGARVDEFERSTRRETLLRLSAEVGVHSDALSADLAEWLSDPTDEGYQRVLDRSRARTRAAQTEVEARFERLSRAAEAHLRLASVIGDEAETPEHHQALLDVCFEVWSALDALGKAPSADDLEAGP